MDAGNTLLYQLNKKIMNQKKSTSASFQMRLVASPSSSKTTESRSIRISKQGMSPHGSNTSNVVGMTKDSQHVLLPPGYSSWLVYQSPPSCILKRRSRATSLLSVSSLINGLLFIVILCCLGAVTQGNQDQGTTSVNGQTPNFFTSQLKQLIALQKDNHNLKEFIRHQRQIKFKSSYSELPEVLRRAEERNQAGKSLTETLHVIPEESASRESSALKEFPPTSEVYFSPEIDELKDNIVTRHFGKTVSSSQRNPFRFRTKSPPSIQFKKRGRLIKKKMVGKKLLRAAIPKPKRVKQNSIKFETSSTENVENTIQKSRPQRRKTMRSGRFQSIDKIVSKDQSGGPNPDKSFNNPFYVETPAWEKSSYSSVPAASASANIQRRQRIKTHKSAIPTPSKLTFNSAQTQSSFAQENKLKKNNRNRARFLTKKVTKPISEKIKIIRTVMKKRKKQRTDLKTSKNVSRNAQRFLSHLQNSNRKKIHKESLKSDDNNAQNLKVKSTKTSHQKTIPTRGKSLASARMPQALQKLVQRKTGFPNLLKVPITNFDCGIYKGGEYIADIDTKCQVFHVCFGGRQASFVCPVGTAFSQQLLVCDWWHKVQCGGDNLWTNQQEEDNHI